LAVSTTALRGSISKQVTSMNSDGSSSIVVVDEKHRKPGVIITVTKSQKNAGRRERGVNEWFAAVRARVPRGAQLQIPWWLTLA